MTRMSLKPIRRLLEAGLLGLMALPSLPALAQDYDPIAAAAAANASLKNKPGDAPQLGLSHLRNNVTATQLPLEWDVKAGKNIKFSARLGSQTYASPVVANGKVFVGTNNSAGFVKRFPSKVDLGCLVAYDAETGKFLWQHSNEKLPTGRVNDWEQLGICSSPVVSGDKLWYISNRDELCCLDTEGFLDNENDGPFKEEPNQNKDEADVIWKLDLMKLGASPHNASSCSITVIGDTLLATSSNGVDEGHKKVAQVQAPVFLAIDKNTGKVLWSDGSSGANIMHGTWSSPCFGEQPDVATLLEHRHAEPRLLAECEPEVGPSLFLEFLLVSLGGDRLHQGDRVVRLQRLGFELQHPAPRPDHRRLAGGNVQIAGLVVDHRLQQLVDLDRAHGNSG